MAGRSKARSITIFGAGRSAVRFGNAGSGLVGFGEARHGEDYMIFRARYGAARCGWEGHSEARSGKAG